MLATNNRPFHDFFFSTFDMDKLEKIRLHHRKERLKIGKISKFESDLLKAYKDTAPQSRKILQTFVWWGAQTCPPPHYRKVCLFPQLT